MDKSYAADKTEEEDSVVKTVTKRKGSEDPKAETQFVHQSKGETQCISKLKDEFKIEMQSKPIKNYIVNCLYF